LLTIFFEPHASTVDNEAGLASGHYDADLSDEGRREAEYKRPKLLRLGVETVYTSNLKRAYKTAKIIFSETRVPIIQDARLRECDYGDMTRKSRREVFGARINAVASPFPNGESYSQVVDRMKSILDEIALKHMGQKIFIIGHFATLVGLEYWLNGRSIQDAFQIEYNQIEFPLQYILDNASVKRPIAESKRFSDPKAQK
jgi:broad specificity phosphatase PhoE